MCDNTKNPSLTIYGAESVPKVLSKTKPTPRKSILKNTDDVNYIHSDIEWNEDKKFLRDPVVNKKVIKAREEHIKRVKEEATKLYEKEKERLEISSQSSTDSEKDAKLIFGQEMKENNSSYNHFDPIEEKEEDLKGKIYLSFIKANPCPIGDSDLKGMSKLKQKRRKTLDPNKTKRVSILDEASILYIEDRECLQRMQEELEEEERLKNPKPTKKRKRRKRY